jgi:hypothetical protein
VVTTIEFKSKFPDVTFVEGVPQALDQNERPYKTYALGGLHNSGDLVPAMINAKVEQVWDAFVSHLRTVLGNNKFVVVRSWPALDSVNKIVIDESDCFPNLSYLKVYKIMARFSIYKDEFEFVHGRSRK